MLSESKNHLIRFIRLQFLNPVSWYNFSLEVPVLNNIEPIPFRLKRNYFNLLSANPQKWSNILKQFVGKLPTNCLSVFDHFVGLALKGLRIIISGISTAKVRSCVRSVTSVIFLDNKACCTFHFCFYSCKSIQ